VLGLALGARQVAERGGRHLRSSRGARRRRRTCVSRTARRESRSQTGMQSARGPAAYTPVEPSQGLCNKLAHRRSMRDNGGIAAPPI